ncbi:hypothetical protein, partial [Pseudomonas aeruginosa]|uniref:hypothetical protein n=2 Tax=Pseudomonas aeruginosa TaxID=287 RepID=UPI001ABD3E24
ALAEIARASSVLRYFGVMSALSLNSIWRFVFYFLFCGDLFSKIKKLGGDCAAKLGCAVGGVIGSV